MLSNLYRVLHVSVQRVACKFERSPVSLLLSSLDVWLQHTTPYGACLVDAVVVSRTGELSLLEKQKACRAREPARHVTRSLTRRELRACILSATVYEISIEFFLDRNVDTLPFPLPLSPFNPSPLLLVPSSLFFFPSFSISFSFSFVSHFLSLSLFLPSFVASFLLPSLFIFCSLSFSRFTLFFHPFQNIRLSQPRPPPWVANPPRATCRTWFPHQRKLFVNEA